MKLIQLLSLSCKSFFRAGHRGKNTAIILVAAMVLFNVVVSLFDFVKEDSAEQITQNEGLKYLQVTSVADDFDFNDTSRIEKLEGVDAAFLDITAAASLEFGEKGLSATLLGLDNNSLSAILGYAIELEEDEIIVDKSFIDAGIMVGDSVNISYNVAIGPDQGIREAREVVVKGSLEEFHIASLQSGTEIIANIEFVLGVIGAFRSMDREELCANLGSTTLYIITTDIDCISQVAKILEDEGYLTSYALKSAQGLPLLARIIGWLGTILFTTLLVFGSVSAGSLTSQIIRSRFKQIGVLKAMGFSGLEVFGLFFFEVLFTWFIAVMVALGLSFVSVAVINNILAKNLAMAANISMTGMQVVASALIILVAVSLGSFFSIYKAAKITPVDCFRSE